MLYKSDIKKINVSLWIAGFDSSPDEITKKLGIEPTETLIKGDYRFFGKGKHLIKKLNKQNAWILKSPLSQKVKPDRHLEHILNIIQSKKQRFIEIFNKYDSRISLAIYWDYCNPGITLDKKILKELAELNIEVGFDTYYLGEDF